MDQNSYPPPPPPYGPGAQYPPNMQKRVRFDAIGEAWQYVTQQMGIWVGSILLMYVLLYAGIFLVFLVLVPFMPNTRGGLNGAASPDVPVVGLLLMFVAYLGLFVFLNVMLCGLHRMAIKQVKGEPISLSDLFSCFDVVGSVIGASLLTALAVTVGFMLCIIPGYIIAGLLMLANPIIADQKVGAMKAMEMSWSALRDDMVMAALFIFVLPLVVFLGALACGIGILFTMPIFFLAHAIVYRDFFLIPASPPVSYPPQGYNSPPPPQGDPPSFEV
jgi:hypothetical protein